MKKNISEQTVFHRFIHIVIDIINILLHKYIYFYRNMCKKQFQRPSRKIGKLLRHCLSNMRLKLEIS